MEFLAGLGLFLLGIHAMREGVQRSGSVALRKLVGVGERGRLRGIGLGMAFAAGVQSVGLTVTMVAGLCNTGTLALAQACYVILGANLGATLTGWIVALLPGSLAGAVLLGGAVLLYWPQGKGFKQAGAVIAGLGMLFVGMFFLERGLSPLLESGAFLTILGKFSANPLLSLLLGAALSSLLQSSATAIVLSQVLAGLGLMPLEMSICLGLGAGAGACLTTGLACLGAGLGARRTALLHLLCNFFAIVLTLALLRLLPLAQGLGSLAADNLLVQVTLANSSMRLMQLLLLAPFAGALEKLCQWLIRGEEPAPQDRQRMHMDELLLVTPPIAMGKVLQEVERLAALCQANFDQSMKAFFTQDLALAAVVEQKEALINTLDHDITCYLTRLGQAGLSEGDVSLAASLYHVVNDLERIGDHAKNIAEYTRKAKSDKLSFTKQGQEEMADMVKDVLALVALSLDIFKTRDRSRLQQAADLEEAIDTKEKTYRLRHSTRLSGGLCALESGRLFADMLTNLERVADHAINIAFSIVGIGGSAVHP